MSVNLAINIIIIIHIVTFFIFLYTVYISAKKLAFNVIRKTLNWKKLKIAGLRLATLLKKDSGIGVFLWFLRNF